MQIRKLIVFSGTKTASGSEYSKAYCCHLKCEMVFWTKKRTWFTGADGVVVCWPTVGVVPTEAGADRQTLPLELVAVFSFRAVRVGSAI
jgi:hypothetical protein